MPHQCFQRFDSFSFHFHSFIFSIVYLKKKALLGFWKIDFGFPNMDIFRVNRYKVGSGGRTRIGVKRGVWLASVRYSPVYQIHDRIIDLFKLKSFDD